MNQDTKEQFEIIIHLVKEIVGIYRGAISQFGISENEFWIWYTLIIMKGNIPSRIFAVHGRFQSKQ